MNLSNITAAIVTYNRPQLLNEVLIALTQQTKKLNKILILDNASDLATKELLQQWKDKSDIEYISLPHNIGGAGGFAQAIEKSLTFNNDWIWLMDDDAVPATNALELLCNSISKLPKKTGVLCSTVMEFGSIAPLHRRYFNPRTLKELPVALDQYSLPYITIDTASFVGFLLNCSVVRQIGLPNSHYFIAYDDTEYSLRIKQAGWILYLIPSSIIYHKRLPSGRLRHSPYGLKHFYNLRNQLIVFRQYGTAPSWRLLIPISQHFLIALRSFSLASIHLWWKAYKESKKLT